MKEQIRPPTWHLKACDGHLGLASCLRVFTKIVNADYDAITDPINALKDSYYIVASIALLLSVICFLGLRNLEGEDGKGWKILFRPASEERESSNHSANLLEAMMLGFRVPRLGIAYLGGFVARASSIGITLFVPLFVNTYFISSGMCNKSGQDLEGIKENCRDAYRLAAILTGVSQLVGLICAPIFGYLADRYRRYNIVLLFAAILGVIGYLALAALKSPRIDGKDGTPWIFVIMALLGVSQIGAIVCSLGLLGRCVLGLQDKSQSGTIRRSHDQLVVPPNASSVGRAEPHGQDDESAPLLNMKSMPRDFQHLKGSIAGIYSFSGGLGILLLTKLGGVLFDKSSAAPFLMLSAFNALLLAVGLVHGLSELWQRKVLVYGAYGRSGGAETSTR